MISHEKQVASVSVRHSVTLANKENCKVFVCQKHYERAALEFKWDDESYCFNVIEVPIVMEKVHQKVYPELYDALKSAENTSDKRNVINIMLNDPQKEWVKAPVKANPNDSRVRIRINSQDLLKRLYECCGSYLDIQIDGFVQSEWFSKGRKKDHPLTKDGILALRVKNDGTTSEETIKMPPGLLGKFYDELKAKISVTLSWFGPEPVYGYLLECKALRKESKMDIKLNVNGVKTYKCHSKLLKECSPVFAAMLRNDMKEQQSMEIKIDDFDCPTIEAFLRFVYTGNVIKQYRDCHLCFHLLQFSHKYNISELEEICRAIFLIQPNSWIANSDAVDLYLFSSRLPEYENVAKRIKSILRMHQKELEYDDSFKQMLTDFPGF